MGPRGSRSWFQKAQIFLDLNFLFKVGPGSALTQWKGLEENIRLHSLKPFYKGAGPTREDMALMIKLSLKAITVLEKFIF